MNNIVDALYYKFEHGETNQIEYQTLSEMQYTVDSRYNGFKGANFF